jgi:riboflavin biosynthesis pyrimidine reductase
MSRRFLGTTLAVAALAALINTGISTSQASAAESPFRRVITAGAGWLTHRDRVLAYDTDVYEIRFTGRQPARIVVDGDGDTDLDCRVFDQAGRLVDADTDFTDYCVLEWVPSRTQRFQLKIQNLGDVYNVYTLRTN